MKPSEPAPPRVLGLRSRLTLVSVALTAIGMLGADAYVSRKLSDSLDERARDDLSVRVSMVGSALRQRHSLASPEARALALALASSSGTRLTLIDPTGAVTLDSQATSALPNHNGRPEVIDARTHGVGVSRRQSETLGSELLYVARRIDMADGPWVVRLAISPTITETARDTSRRFLGIGAIVGLLTAAALSWIAVELLSRPVRDLTRTARAMEKDLTVRTRLQGHDELSALASALDALADNLATSLASLERERDRLEAILEAMAEGVLVTDGDGVVVLANRALREVFRLRGDVVGSASRSAVPNGELHEVVAEVMSSSHAVSRELVVERERGRTLRVIARVAPVEAPATGIVAVLSDVTELRRLETVRRDFVANVSHELRTPVAAIRAAAETLLSGALEQPDTGREFVSIVDRHAERLHRLVEDLLELSRLEARELNLTLEPLAVDEAVQHAVELFALAVKARRTRLQTDVAEGLPKVEADRRALEQVLSNLIDNAIKYSPEGASVTVRARRHHDGVRISVLDSGPGIEAHHLPRLFERFYRADKSRSRQLGGTGLGLAIVKHLSEAMGARSSVESVVGEGTTFHVDLKARANTTSIPPPR